MTSLEMADRWGEYIMGDYQSAFQKIASAVEGIELLRRTAFHQYSILVDAVMNNQITDQQEIQKIMDGLSNFGDQEEFLELSKKLYRHIYYTYPEMVGKYAALFRAMFMNNAASGEENSDT